MDLVLAGLLGAIAVGAVAAILVLRIQRRTQQLVADTASLRAELGAEQEKHNAAAKKAADADELKVEYAAGTAAQRHGRVAWSTRRTRKALCRHLRGVIVQDAGEPTEEFPHYSR